MKIVLGIITKQDKILIGKVKAEKIKDFGEIKYIFPGGKVNEEETIENAILREIEEETGLNTVIYN